MLSDEALDARQKLPLNINLAAYHAPSKPSLKLPFNMSIKNKTRPDNSKGAHTLISSTSKLTSIVFFSFPLLPHPSLSTSIYA